MSESALPHPDQEPKTFSWMNASFLVGVPLLAIALTPWAYRSGGLTWGAFLYAVIHYLCEGISITAGYHRLFAHRSYRAHPIVRALVLFFGAGAMQNSALAWAHDHRIHHRHEDTDQDPYNIKKGFWWAHIGWIFYASNSRNLEQSAPADLRGDRLLMWQHRNYLLVALSAWMGLPLLFGFIFGNPIGFFVVGALWRVLWTSHCTYLINSAAHVFGKATYSLKATARDNWFLAFFTFGEGYHNFHHKFQADYRNGIRWWQFDPTKWLIATFKFFGLASDLNRTSEARILLAQMQTKKQLLQERGVDTQSLDRLQESMEHLFEEWRQLKVRFEDAKIKSYERGSELVQQLKLQLDELKQKQTAVYEQWLAQWTRLSLPVSL